MTKVLVLGGTGMLGSAALKLFSASNGFDVVASVRSPTAVRLLPAELQDRVQAGIDVENYDNLAALFARVRPDVVINCVGLVKQLSQADDPLSALPLNSMLPHRLVSLCALVRARLVHVSTDCVFSGTKGMYVETDVPDARDLYGISKYIGEVDAPHAVTLRTSIIGHELAAPHGLVGWFLAQRSKVNGFRRAIFSGLPTVELVRVVRDVVLQRPELHGVYHVSAAPITKYELLRLIAHEYGKSIEISIDDSVVIDRSLDSSRFQAITGYVPPDWPALVAEMHRFG